MRTYNRAYREAQKVRTEIDKAKSKYQELKRKYTQGRLKLEKDVGEYKKKYTPYISKVKGEKVFQPERKLPARTIQKKYKAYSTKAEQLQAQQKAVEQKFQATKKQEAELNKKIAEYNKLVKQAKVRTTTKEKLPSEKAEKIIAEYKKDKVVLQPGLTQIIESKITGETPFFLKQFMTPQPKRSVAEKLLYKGEIESKLARTPYTTKPLSEKATGITKAFAYKTAGFTAYPLRHPIKTIKGVHEQIRYKELKPGVTREESLKYAKQQFGVVKEKAKYMITKRPEDILAVGASIYLTGKIVKGTIKVATKVKDIHAYRTTGRITKKFTIPATKKGALVKDVTKGSYIERAKLTAGYPTKEVARVVKTKIPTHLRTRGETIFQVKEHARVYAVKPQPFEVTGKMVGTIQKKGIKLGAVKQEKYLIQPSISKVTTKKGVMFISRAEQMLKKGTGTTARVKGITEITKVYKPVVKPKPFFAKKATIPIAPKLIIKPAPPKLIATKLQAPILATKPAVSTAMATGVATGVVFEAKRAYKSELAQRLMLKPKYKYETKPIIKVKHIAKPKYATAYASAYKGLTQEKYVTKQKFAPKIVMKYYFKPKKPGFPILKPKKRDFKRKEKKPTKYTIKPRKYVYKPSISALSLPAVTKRPKKKVFTGIELRRVLK